ncbi:MAG TPA: guanylate kinase [Steroidobacteraceae bacterium]|jgi:guanylate kinase
MARLFVISAPSGAGKTSLVGSLLAARPNLNVSVSHTTRKPRPNEVEGRDYYFVTLARFRELIEQQAFLEYAQVFDNFYGTGAAQVRDKLAAGNDVLLEIDWQGARQVRRAMPDSTSIFILPPTRAALEQRLHERRTDSPETIARRLADASTDMSHYNEFDFVVVNDRFEKAAVDVDAILDGGGRELRANRADLKPLIETLVR